MKVRNRNKQGNIVLYLLSGKDFLSDNEKVFGHALQRNNSQYSVLTNAHGFIIINERKYNNNNNNNEKTNNNNVNLAVGCYLRSNIITNKT